MPAKRRKRQHTGKSGSRSGGSVPGWASMLFGLSIGLGVALVVWLQSNPAAVLPGRTAGSDQAIAQTTVPAASRTPAPSATTAVAAAGGSNTAAAAAASPATGTAAGEAGDEADEEYSFFRTLPQSEVVIPDSEFRAREQADPAAEYIIQAGAYRAFADADSAQAKLALLGIEAKVESAIVGNLLYHRVIIGPLSGREEVNSTVRRLNAARIESMPPRPISR